MNAWLLVLSVLCASPPSKLDEARDAAHAAQVAYKQRRFKAAAQGFETALRLSPRPALHFNLALSLEALGETSAALREYREYLRLAPDAEDKGAVEESVRALAKRLRANEYQLQLLAEPSTASISLDGTELGMSPQYAEVPAGAHTVTVSAPGYAARTVQIQVDAQHQTSVTRLEATDVPTTTTLLPQVPALELSLKGAPAPRPHPLPWITLGTSVAAAAVAVGLGVGANQASSELRSAQHVRADADVLVHRTQDLALGANIMWAVAGTALATSAVLFIIGATH